MTNAVAQPNAASVDEAAIVHRIASDDRSAFEVLMRHYNRHLYRDEVAGLIARLNTYMQPGAEPLYTPDIKFNRNIGKWAGQKFHPQTGAPVEEKEYAQQIDTWLPTEQDQKTLVEIIKNEKGWIAEKAGARDPLASIGEVRKSAINI